MLIGKADCRSGDHEQDNDWLIHIVLLVGKPEYRPMDECPNRSYLIFSRTMKKKCFQIRIVCDRIAMGSLLSGMT